MTFESVRHADGSIADFRWLMTSPTAERMIGHTHEELSGRLLLDVFPCAKTHGHFAAFTRVVETNVPFHGEVPYNHRGRDARFRTASIKVADGFAMTLADISAHSPMHHHPVAIGDDLTDHPADEPTRAPADKVTNPPETARSRILLVDDLRDNRDFLAYLLRDRGLDVAVADNGRDAVDAALTTPFHLVIMDMHMPEMDGYEATRCLRALGFTMPIIALTADAHPAGRARALEAGCSQHLTKPIDLDVVLAAIETHLPRQPG